MAKLKVFHGATMRHNLTGHRQCSCCMATTNIAKFLKAADTTKTYISITGNEEQVRVCMGSPETLFINKNGTNHPNEWIKHED